MQAMKPFSVTHCWLFFCLFSSAYKKNHSNVNASNDPTNRQKKKKKSMYTFRRGVFKFFKYPETSEFTPHRTMYLERDMEGGGHFSSAAAVRISRSGLRALPDTFWLVEGAGTAVYGA